jgi:hypothetical protein
MEGKGAAAELSIVKISCALKNSLNSFICYFHKSHLMGSLTNHGRNMTA